MAVSPPGIWSLLTSRDNSVTPPGSHLSEESSLSCVPSATGHFYCSSSSWVGSEWECLRMTTMDAVLTVVFFMSSLPAVCSIRSTLEIHLEVKDLPPLPELESLPEEIRLGQSADVWRAAVEFKRR